MMDENTLATYYKSVIFAVLLIAFEVQGFAECGYKRFPAYITGFGEDHSYDRAKVSASVDAMSFFGVQLKSSSVVLVSGQANQDSLFSEVSYSELKTFAKGIIVLERCLSAGRHQITVGVRKNYLWKLLVKRSLRRIQFIETSLFSLHEIDSMNVKSRVHLGKNIVTSKEREVRDLDAWVILGYQPITFPKMNLEDIQVLETALKRARKSISVPIRLVANDRVGRVSLAAVKKHLEHQGYRITKHLGDLVEWQCIVKKGYPQGSLTRFQTNCMLIGVDSNLNLVSVDGIETFDRVVDSSGWLISQRVRSLL